MFSVVLSNLRMIKPLKESNGKCNQLSFLSKYYLFFNLAQIPPLKVFCNCPRCIILSTSLANVYWLFLDEGKWARYSGKKTHLPLRSLLLTILLHIRKKWMLCVLTGRYRPLGSCQNTGYEIGWAWKLDCEGWIQGKQCLAFGLGYMSEIREKIMLKK